MSSDDAMAANRRRWDELVAVNLKSPLYRVEAFRRGETPGLRAFEWQEIGPVAGLDARFVEGNLYDAPRLIGDRFDLVYVTWGTICWLPDIGRWAEIVAGFLKPGGRFYFCDAHPLALTLDDKAEQAPLRVRYPYFHEAEPLVFDDATAYGDPSARLVNRRSFEWMHGLGEVVGALLAAGLSLDHLCEHEFCLRAIFPIMTEGEDGLWRLPETWPRLPLSYSLLAAKPAD